MTLRTRRWAAVQQIKVRDLAVRAQKMLRAVFAREHLMLSQEHVFCNGRLKMDLQSQGPTYPTALPLTVSDKTLHEQSWVQS